MRQVISPRRVRRDSARGLVLPLRPTDLPPGPLNWATMLRQLPIGGKFSKASLSLTLNRQHWCSGHEPVSLRKALCGKPREPGVYERAERCIPFHSEEDDPMRVTKAGRVWPLVGLITVALAAACTCEFNPDVASIDCVANPLPAPDTRIELVCTVVAVAENETASVTKNDTIPDPKP